tara:strand:- start:8086 stop:8973 length:888 start_codon:yes stop_codon:yes gene_type:complete
MFIGIDPAINNIGVTIIDNDGKHKDGKLIKNLDKSGYQIIQNTKDILKEAIEKYKPIAIGREDVIYGGYANKGIDRSSDLSYMAGIIDSLCGEYGYTENNLKLIKLPNKTWQKYIWGKADMYNKKAMAIYISAMSQCLNHIYKKGDSDLADAHAVAITIRDIWLVTKGLLDPLDLSDAQIEALLSRSACEAVSTGKITVKNKIRRTGNRELFHAFMGFETPKYAKSYRIDSASKETAFGFAFSHKIQLYINKKRKILDRSINFKAIEELLEIIFDGKRVKNLHQGKRAPSLKILI